ncbi:sterol desaturase family protein [Zoogloea sp.]|jgi:sterol desaturase/sphingolipid hydroxylase (fatty acid hydroxylase superfamily)|uniref:sterol desaturase family protein n=1 Tax=Zoogloea sp. TaxID=49181 RepID=UPI0037DA3E23
MIAFLTDLFVATQGWLFDSLVQPALFALGLASYVEMGFEGIEFVLIGILELAIAYSIMRPLEALWPAERWSGRKAVRVDVLYTVLNRLGVIPLAVFALLAPAFMALDGWLRFHDMIPRQLEDWLPTLDTHPLASFVIYLLILDFAEYWRHRLSHTFGWWWALHGIHHSQRQMSFWTDSRNHLLDDLIAGMWFAGLSLLIGVPPGHFIGLLVTLRLVENLSHTNTRLGFGRLGDYLIVGPRYHRWHHALDLPSGERYRHGCNFAILFPFWDAIFGTLHLEKQLPPTGIREDSAEALAARDDFWRQQKLGLVLLWRALTRPRTGSAAM